MTHHTIATAMIEVLIRHEPTGSYVRTSPEVRAARRRPDEAQAHQAAAFHDDTGGFFFSDFIQLAMPTAAPIREPGKRNIDPVPPQTSSSNVE
jgi:hypothetical protein